MTTKKKVTRKTTTRRATKKKTGAGAADDAADVPRSRAMWKGEVALGEDRLPIKLHAAAQGGRPSFRLLHQDDLLPVRQRQVSSVSGEEVTREEVQRAYEVETGTYVILEDEDLAGLEPEASRTIEVVGYVEPLAIAEPLHERPYHVAPDGDEETYAALVEALAEAGRVALVRWVMRKKRYIGALAAREGRLLLTTLRREDEVVLLEGFEAPGGRALDAKERALAGQLVDALEGAFEHDQFHEEYSRRVAELVEAKSKGKKVPRRRAKAREETSGSLASALQKSLRAAKEKTVA